MHFQLRLSLLLEWLITSIDLVVVPTWVTLDTWSVVKQLIHSRHTDWIDGQST